MTTMTALPFMGGELSSFDISASTVIERTTSEFAPAKMFNGAFARCAIFCPNGTFMTTPTWLAAADFSFHADMLAVNANFNPTAALTLQFFEGSTEVFRLEGRNDVTTTWTVSTLQSGAMTAVGTFLVPIDAAGYNTYDFRLVAGAAGSCAAYSGGNPAFSVSSLDHSGFAGVTQVKLWSFGDGSGFGVTGPAFWSQVICDDVPHVGDNLKTIPIDTDSAVNVGWTGTVANVNEIVLDDSVFVAAGAAGLVSTYFAAGFSLTGYTLGAIGVAARAKANPAAPQNLNLALRSGGANFFSADIPLDVGYQACFKSWRLDPATGAAWTPAAAQAVEGGQRSIA